jgi:uncharacterized membrane protein YozB (DUF420 family)
MTHNQLLAALEAATGTISAAILIVIAFIIIRRSARNRHLKRIDALKARTP